MYSLYDQHDTTKDREQTERRWGEKQREREREREVNTAQTESSLKPAACIVKHYALLLSKHAI